jgi:PhnB protein
MAGAALQPYLNFDGNCREAMEFYHGVLGGELDMTTFKDFKMGDSDKIMHAIIRHDALTFMGSDGPEGNQVQFGNNVHLSIAGTDGARLKRFWQGLSAGGRVTMPLAKQAWGDEFGMFTDKFGFHWMINITSPENAAK